MSQRSPIGVERDELARTVQRQANQLKTLNTALGIVRRNLSQAEEERDSLIGGILKADECARVKHWDGWKDLVGLANDVQQCVPNPLKKEVEW